ncbi:hypothetical protein NDA13_001286 [Ustilago tritici]|nr:hypothetical protein NDA13_001286 [Ustilago tritici]
MYGSPDDVSTVSQNTNPTIVSGMQSTISDSDVLRDAKHVHWQPLPFIPDTALTSLPSRSKDSLIDADVSSSTKSKRGFGNVKAKIKAVARFLGSKDRHEEDAGFNGFTAKGVPIAGLNPQSILLKDGGDEREEMRSDGKVQSDYAETKKSEMLPAIETLRERLSSEEEVCKKPPPPPQPQIYRPPSPRLLAPAALRAKCRRAIGSETPLLFSHAAEPPQTRSGTPRPAFPPAVRVVSRPLPPTPAHNPRAPGAEPQLRSYSPTDDYIARLSAAGQNPPTPGSSPGLGLSQLDGVPTPPTADPNTYDDTPAPPLPAQPFLSIRRAKNTLDATLLAAELESLSSFTTSSTRFADSSREAVCHWRPQDEVPTSVLPPLPTPHQNPRKRPPPSTPTSLQVEESEDESIQRIQRWRVQITAPPSVVLGSQVPSDHSRFQEEQAEEMSSHLTSVSRSPLSKPNSAKSLVEDLVDMEKTPTLQAKRVVGRESARSYKSPPRPNRHEREEGTSHIARLSDSQFDRLALTTESVLPPPPAPIPAESNNSRLRPKAAINKAEERDEGKRSSLDATGTTLSVLERKASTHINTLDSMIRKHPDKMYEIFKNRPGLMLVVMLRCKVEDRISEVQATPPVLVDLAPSTSGRGKEKDGIDLLEESLIDLHFDEEATSALQEPRGVPSIVVSQHHTGDSGAARSRTAATSVGPLTEPYVEGGMGREQSVVEAKIERRSEGKLLEIVQRLEEAGELCSMQQVLMSLQERLMTTKGECSRLSERLSVVSIFVEANVGKRGYLLTNFLLPCCLSIA